MKQNEITPIKSNDPDYYAWGKNCYILGFDRDITAKIYWAFEAATPKKRIDKNFDLFWSGYYAKENGL